jgi:hypothetical protein
MVASGGLNRRGHPAIKAILTTRPGEANTKRVSVTLPDAQLLDNSHIGTVCTRVAFAKDACPRGARIGRAEATSPLLDQPLEGAVYLRSSSKRLPDLAIDLKGQIDIVLTGRIDSVGGSLRANFGAVPDAPVSRFVLNLAGGAKGLVVNTESLCGRAKRARTTMVGQNGAVVRLKTKFKAECGSKRRAER